jgi:hypothetical protein
MILQGKTPYIVTPYDPEPVDRIQVLRLSDDLLSAKRVKTITDGAFDGVASGAIFGDSLYVNNAGTSIFRSRLRRIGSRK